MADEVRKVKQGTWELILRNIRNLHEAEPCGLRIKGSCKMDTGDE